VAKYVSLSPLSGSVAEMVKFSLVSTSTDLSPIGSKTGELFGGGIIGDDETVIEIVSESESVPSVTEKTIPECAPTSDEVGAQSNF